MSHILERKQSLFLDATIQHYFHVCYSNGNFQRRWQISKLKGVIKMYYVQSFKVKQKIAILVATQSLESSQSYLPSRSFNDSLMQSESHVTTDREGLVRISLSISEKQNYAENIFNFFLTLKNHKKKKSPRSLVFICQMLDCRHSLWQGQEFNSTNHE